MTQSPYVGLAPYEQSDQPFFFGRSRFIETLKQRVLTEDVTILYGASGVGKTSTLNAGLISALADERAAVVSLGRWQDPARGLEETKRLVLELAAGARPGLDAPLTAIVRTVAGRMDRDLVLLLDQFEELFANATPDRSAIQEIGDLLGSHSPGVHIIVSLRDDFLSRLDVFKGQAPGLLRTVVRLERLNQREAREAIVRPAEMSGIAIEDGLPEMVIRGLQASGSEAQDNHPDSAPQTVEAAFLQIVMSRLWEEEARLGSRVLRKETLERLGRPGRLVSTHLDDKLAQLSTKEKDACAYAFRYLVTTHGTKIAQTPEDLADWADVELAVLLPALERLAHERVLTHVRGSDGRVRFEIYHDLLVAKILDWRTRYLQQRDVKKARKQARRYWMWALAGAMGVILVLGGYAVKQWIGLHQANFELNRTLQDKDQLIRDNEKANRDRSDAQKQAFAEEKQRLEAQRKQLVAENQRLEAERAQREAETVAAQQQHRSEDEYRKRKSAELLRMVQQQRELAPDLALWLLAHAVQLAPDHAIQDELASRLSTRIPIDRVAPATVYGANDISANGKVACDIAGNRIRIWDVESGRVRQHLAAPENVASLQLNADGSQIAIVTPSINQVVDLATGKPVETIPCQFQVRFSGLRLDATFRYSFCNAPQPVLRHIAGGEHATLGLHAGGFSPDGRLAATGDNSAITIYDLAPESRPFQLTTGQIRVEAEGVDLSMIAFDASGRSVVTVGRKQDPSGSGTWVLAFGTLDRSTHKVDFDATRMLFDRCDPNAISLSPDGSHAAVNCTNVSVMMVDRGSFANNLLDSAENCRFGVSNDKLLCAGTARIEIRSRSGEHLATLPPAASEVSSAILSPNGSRLARLDRNNVVVVTDTGTGDDLWWKNVGDSLFLFTSGDGQTLYGGAYDNHFAVPWDGKGEIRVPGFVAAGFDGRRIAVLDGSRIHIRASGSEIDEATVSPPFDTTEAVFVNRDKALALTTNRGRGAVVEIATGKVLYPIPLGRSLLASPSGGCLAIRTSNRLEILDAVTGDSRGALAIEDPSNVLALDDECRNVVTASTDFASTTFVVYDLRSGASRFTWRAGYTAFWAAALPPNGREVVIAEGTEIARFPLLSRDELVAEALRRVGSKFDTECQKYLERPCPSGQ